MVPATTLTSGNALLDAIALRVKTFIEQIFDILPIRSSLRPGESEEVQFVYYGHANRKAIGKCACDVKGGPTYTVNLVGEASNVGFR